jgi:hypothetical protein
MQVIHRRLIVISAIALFGAAAGLTLGHFVAGPESNSSGGVNESYGLDTGLMSAEGNVADGRDSPARSGPTSYTCEGCDTRLHNDMVGGNDMAPADVEPLPPYRSEDATAAPRAGLTPSSRRDMPTVSPRSPGPAAPSPAIAPTD